MFHFSESDLKTFRTKVFKLLLLSRRFSERANICRAGAPHHKVGIKAQKNATILANLYPCCHFTAESTRQKTFDCSTSFFPQWFSSHSSIEVRFLVCQTNSCPVDRLSHLSCGPLQLL
ncbi:hypothetical protein CHARACLAT_030472 [Characodon lateralis]|uniref:Uncharacterized protein n=1 Tax=Characodon lateralis TaxID=208331 RepID=A0ABU7CVY2_9TELE|nr:hypothetical protein [Characodon lateralis]